MGSEGSLCPFVFEKSEVVVVKPAKSMPDVSLSLSTLDNDPSAEFILKTVSVFAPKPYLEDQANHDPFVLLKDALSHALVFYYPLAGKLRRKSDDNRLELNFKAGDGVPFIRATATCTLSSLNYLENSGNDAYQLVPCYSVRSCEGYDPVALQVTKFACGGITIGMAVSHSVCDGVGMAQFFRAIIELASGKSQPTVIPVWKRERLSLNHIKDELKEDNQTLELIELLKASSSIATSPYIPSNDMVREILNITSEYIKKLKKIIKEEEQVINEKNNEDVGVTTLEIIAALMWRAKCRALKLNPKGVTVLEISVGLRSILEPPLPKGYYGNAVINAPIALTTKELSESKLSHVVRLIKETKRAALDKRYAWGQVSMIEKRLNKMAVFEGQIGGFMTLTDWRHIGLQYDYWGGLVSIIPLFPMAVPFVSVLLPASKAVPGMSGSVRLQVTLPRDAMSKFKEEMNAFELSNHEQLSLY